METETLIGYIIRVSVWWGLFYGAVKLEFGLVFLIVSGLGAIVWHLRSGSDAAAGPANPNQPKVSAYAAFNKNGAKIPGSMDASQFERELRHQPMVEENATGSSAATDDASPVAAIKRNSKHANKPCPCGSGKKFKHCCSNARAATSKQKEEFAKWQAEWGDEEDDDGFDS